MWFSGLPICCDVRLPRVPATELVQVPTGPDDWAITGAILTGTTACRTCDKTYLYSLKPTADELRTVPVLDIRYPDRGDTDGQPPLPIVQPGATSRATAPEGPCSSTPYTR